MGTRKYRRPAPMSAKKWAVSLRMKGVRWRNRELAGGSDIPGITKRKMSGVWPVRSGAQMFIAPELRYLKMS